MKEMEMELINKKDTINHIMGELDDSEEYNEGLRTAATIVDQEDYYEIVLCQDCKYGEFPAHNVRCSEFYGAGCYNGFCAWGEKK